MCGRPMQSTLSHKKGSKALAKLVVDSATDKVLGAHMVGPEAAEIIQVSSEVFYLQG